MKRVGTRLSDSLSSNDWVLGALNYDEDLHFSSYYLRASTPPQTEPLYSGYKQIVGYYSPFDEQYFLLKDECRRNAEEIVDQCVNNPNWMPRILDEIVDRCEELSNLFSTNAGSFSNLSKNQLLKIYDKHHNVNKRMYRLARVPESLDRGINYFTKHLKDILREYGVQEGDINQAFLRLTDSRENVLSRFLNDLDQIVQIFRDNCDARRVLYEYTARSRMLLPQKILSKIRDFVDKWKFYCYHGYGKRKLYTYNDCIDDILDELRSPSRNSNDHPHNFESGEISDLKLDDSHKRLFDLYSRIGAVKLLRRYYQLRNFYYLDKLLSEIATRLHVREWTVRCMLPEELRQSIKVSDVVNSQIYKRENGCFYLYHKGNEKVIPESPCPISTARLDDITSSSPDDGKLQGTPASQGVVSATCGVINRADDYEDTFRTGDILVSHSADPDLLPIVKVAGGVVVEQGGVTSHISLVCRERDIPAIIGVDGVLERVEDGDILKINSNTGTVEIVSKINKPDYIISDLASTSKEVGNKARVLHQIQQIEFNTPEFVVVNFSDLKNISSENAGYNEINNLKNWLSHVMPTSKKDLIALRSSTIHEDTEDSSFAGEYESVMSISLENISGGINKFVEENTNNPNMPEYQGGVIVQRMAQPEFSGVSLTSEETIRDKNVLIMEYTRGKNLNITGGSVTPNKIIIDRRTLEILEHDKSEDISLRSTDINSMARKFLELENHFGYPLNIEWSIEDGNLLILQARHIS